jgi:hypothetical protein
MTTLNMYQYRHRELQKLFQVARRESHDATNDALPGAFKPWGRRPDSKLIMS